MAEEMHHEVKMMQDDDPEDLEFIVKKREMRKDDATPEQMCCLGQYYREKARAEGYDFTGGTNQRGSISRDGNAYKQYFRASVFFEMAAKQGFAPAQNELGLLYQFGYGKPQDFERAAALFKSSAATYGQAMVNLAGLYRDGNGVRQSFGKALRLTQQAVKAEAHAGVAASRPPTYFRDLIKRNVQEICWLVGHKVVLHGLSTESMNGVTGTAVDWGCHPVAFSIDKYPAAETLEALKTARYTVKIDAAKGSGGPRTMAVKPGNLSPVP